MSLSFNDPNLKTLPTIPDWIKVLNCEGCSRLEELPSLPTLLEELNCSDCEKLLFLPQLPASLVYLDCSGCLIKSLPQLPVSLKQLKCYGCYELKTLPFIPNSTGVWISGCNKLIKEKNRELSYKCISINRKKRFNFKRLICLMVILKNKLLYHKLSHPILLKKFFWIKPKI